MKRAILTLAAAAALGSGAHSVAADSKAVYDKSCGGCHAVMPPKLGDKVAFAPLIKKGLEAVAAVVIKGKAAMPPRGGAASDADARAAVEYMFSKSK